MSLDRPAIVEVANTYIRHARYEEAMSELLALTRGRRDELEQGATVDALDVRVAILVADLYAQTGTPSTASDFYDVADAFIEQVTDPVRRAQLRGMLSAKRILAHIQDADEHRAQWCLGQIPGGFTVALMSAKTEDDLRNWEEQCEWLRTAGEDEEDARATIVLCYLAGARVMAASLKIEQCGIALRRGAVLCQQSDHLLSRFELDLARLAIFEGDAVEAALRLKASPDELGIGDLPGKLRWHLLDARLARMTGDLGRCKERLTLMSELTAQHDQTGAFIQSVINLAEFQINLNQNSAATSQLQSLMSRLPDQCRPFEQSIDRVLRLAESGAAGDASIAESAVASVYGIGGGSESFQASEEHTALGQTRSSNIDDIELRFNRELFGFRVALDQWNLDDAAEVLANLVNKYGRLESSVVAGRLAFASALLLLADREFHSASDALVEAIECFGDLRNLETWHCRQLLATCFLFTGNWSAATSSMADSDSELTSLTSSLARDEQAVFLLDKSSAEDRYIDYEIGRIEHLDSRYRDSSVWSKPFIWMQVVRRIALLLDFTRRIDRFRMIREEAEIVAAPTSVLNLLLGQGWRRLAIKVLVLPDRTLCVALTFGKVSWTIRHFSRDQVRASVREWHEDAWSWAQNFHDSSSSPDEQTADSISHLNSLACRTAASIGITDLLENAPRRIRRLTIFPDDVLSLFPFSAVRLGNQYLVERFSICYGHDQNPAEKRNGSKAPLVAGVSMALPASESLPAFVALPDVADECNRVCELLEERGDQVPVRLSYDGPRPAAGARTELLRGLQEADFAHIACHGFFNPENALRSGLVVPDDLGNASLVTLQDIAGLDLSNLRFVTLSACFSADSINMPGRWSIGLPQSFCISGVDNIIGSIWLVHDAIGRAFIETIYDQISATTVGAALRKSQMLFVQRKVDIETSMPIQHPFFWASFCQYSRERLL